MGHPSIGAALETLLRIEDRYEVRRAQSLEHASPGLAEWMPDLVLVDGVLVTSGRTEVFAMPAIVLSGNPLDGHRLSAQFAQGRGWLRKDATAPELRTAIDVALSAGRGSPSVARIAVFALVVVVIAFAVAWYLLVMRS